MSKQPKNFFGLHAHTGFSLNDGLGMPMEHFKFVLENGGDGLAITEHGHANSFVYAYLAEKELNKKGNAFKYVKGIEFYIHPDLKQWKIDYELNKEKKKLDKKNKTEEDETGEAETTGTVEDESQSKSNKIKNPLNRRSHLVVLAKTSKGLQNLFSLVSRGYRDGFYRFPRIDYALLKEFGEDLIISTACAGGNTANDIYQEFPGIDFNDLKSSLLDDKIKYENIMRRLENTVDRCVDAVGKENFFLELQFNKLNAQHLLNKCLIDLSKKTGVKLITTGDSHYARPEYWKDRELYKKLGFIKFNNLELGQLPQSVDELKCELYPKNAEQIWKAYKDTTKEYDFYDDDLVCDSIELTHDIAYKLIGDPQPFTDVKLPSWVVPADKTPFKALVEACREGLIARGLQHKPEYVERLKEELGVIKEKNFSSYFLTMKEIIDIARKEVLVNFGRGSSAGSLVCYVLYITNIDPIKYGLLFSRFLNKFRSGWPDIDSDFSDRDKVVNLLKEKYGDENVLYISNYNLFRVKSLVKDIAKFCDIPFEEVNYATKFLDRDVVAGSLKETNEKNTNPTFKEALKYCPTFKDFIDKNPIVAEHVEVLFRQLRTIGCHAGGVIIADNICNKMPVIKSKGKLQTPWCESGTQTHLESMGWVKFDLLGIETLKVIERTIELILQRHKGIKNPTFNHIKNWFEKNLDPNVIDLNDQKVYENVYHQGNWGNIFQFAETPVQKFCGRAKPRSILDIAIITSIFRPSALKADVDKIYIENKNNPENIKYDHPLIKSILEPTFNCLILQEDVMKIANVVGNIPLDECDNLRRLISKKPEKGSEMEKQVLSLENKFIDGAVNNGVPRSASNELWKKMVFFSGYGFNKCLYKETEVETKTGIKKIKDVKIGELVNSKNGFVAVKDVINNGGKILYKLNTKSGKELICTLDHKIETQTGMRTLGDIFNFKRSILTKDSQNDNIISLQYFGKEDTYDLEVDHKEHSFYANGISVSNSHAISYGILSYICAWLLTYYEAEWLCAYLESESKDSVARVKAIGEIKSYKYEIIKPDINHATDKWSIIPNEKKFVQAITSIKGLGEKAYEEILSYRPYKDIYDFLWNGVGQWKHSKLNIKNIGNLIKINSFHGFDCVGEGKLFSNPRHMYEVIVENHKELKHKKRGRDNFEKIRLETYDKIPDWTTEEKIIFQQELLGEFDLELLISNELQKDLYNRGALPIDSFVSDGVYWFMIQSTQIKQSKNGRNFMIINATGKTGATKRIYIWNIDKVKNDPLEQNVVYFSKITQSGDFLGTNRGQIYKLGE